MTQGNWLTCAARLALNGPAGPFSLDVAFAVPQGAFVALSGPSGAGKTTLLRLIAGLTRPDSGAITVAGETWCDTAMRRYRPTRKRPIGFVFQDYALFPNMTARQNVEYALGRFADSQRAVELLEFVQLENLQDAFPARLSGGQKQRLALVRALARRPSILLLDEPLSALDPMMRRHLQDELRAMHRDFGTTTFLVSHDLSEIARLADRVIRLEEGRIVFDGAPVDLFGAPEQPDNIVMVAEHLAGPDEMGVATIRVDGQVKTVRYKTPHAGATPADIKVGDMIVIEIDDVSIRQRI
jgi:molybdate transport system ATP-binding protein